MLSSKVAAHDIRDVESFVRSRVPKTGLRHLSHSEREELVAEGIAILIELAAKYKPRMNGYDKDGSFAGYCSRYLHLKMRTAWHTWHPEHLQRTLKLEDGRVVKQYAYGEAPASLDEQMERDVDLDSQRLRTVGNFIATGK